jgi:hypothetical protein
MLNGVKQNTRAESNVRIQGLRPTFYSCKILADDNSFSIDKNIIVKSDTLITYRIVNKKGKFKLRYYSEVPLVSVTSSSAQTTIAYHNEEIIPISTAVVTPLEGNSTTMDVNMSVGGTDGMESGSMHTTTTTTTTETRDGINTNTSLGTEGESISISMDVSGTGANVDIRGTGLDGQEGINTQISGSETYTESSVTTTTTTTTSGNWTATDVETRGSTDMDADVDFDNDIVDVDWENCYVDDEQFERYFGLFQNESFEDDKTMMAKEFVQKKCLSVANIATLIEGLTFSDDRMTVAKAAFHTCYDSDEYYQLLDKFEFDVDKEELQKFINNQ